MMGIAMFLSFMQEAGYQVFTKGNFNLNIVGYRYRNSKPNHYTDALAVYYKADDCWFTKQYRITTRPGTPHMLKPLNSKGSAILVPGQYIGCYKIGYHKNKYRALVQAAPVKVYRDSDLDSEYDADPGTVEEGYFGINIHRADFISTLVGPNSAGCQVFALKEEFDEFMSLCNEARKYWGNLFTYTLVEL